MQKTSIAPEILQPFLESASNAAAKGQAQFFTPPEFAKQLAALLPRYRPVIADLNCGNGQLLTGTANEKTKLLLGLDIDPVRLSTFDSGLSTQKISGDLCRVYPLMLEVELLFDLTVLNPPWDLHWDKARLAGLKESTLPAVRAAFAADDPRLAKGSIDSTIGTWLIAMDRSSLVGEGLVIANEATMQRLVFGPGAPHSALAKHCWLHLIIDGNPMTGRQDCLSTSDERGGRTPFEAAVIYWATDHSTSPTNIPKITTTAFNLDPKLRNRRRGAEIREWHSEEKETRERWTAVAEEWKSRTAKQVIPSYNLWLGVDGTIKTAVSLFDRKSVKSDKAQAQSLFELNGKVPMQLVLQRATRDLLLHHTGVGGTNSTSSPISPWKVDPKLQAAVLGAVRSYNAARAPLVPLPEIQRLGYLDEEDQITCKSVFSLQPSAFRIGHRYPLRTETFSTKRHTTRPNLAGEPEELEMTGQELAIYIRDENDEEHAFVDARCLESDVELPPTLQRMRSEVGGMKSKHARGRARVPRAGLGVSPKPSANRLHDLQTLVSHFTIPEVPDVSTVNPEGYQRNLALLGEIERICNS